jgi:hypothetical protein
MVRAVKQKYVRDKLNDGQIKILELVYKYRFVSRQLLASSLGVNPQNGLYEKLEILVNNGYLGKRLENRHKLENIPAAYYLTPKGLKYLHLDDSQTLQENYRDKSITGNNFISHYLNIYRQTEALHRQYPALKVFSQRDMRSYSYFPGRLPDAFLSLPSDNPNVPHRFFFDIVRDRQPRGDLINKLKTYTEFFEDGGWDETGSELPVLLLLCEWSPSEKSVQRAVRSQLNRLDSDLTVFTSTASALENATAKRIWTDVNDADELISLDNIDI